MKRARERRLERHLHIPKAMGEQMVMRERRAPTHHHSSLDHREQPFPSRYQAGWTVSGMADPLHCRHRQGPPQVASPTTPGGSGPGPRRHGGERPARLRCCRLKAEGVKISRSLPGRPTRDARRALRSDLRYFRRNPDLGTSKAGRSHKRCVSDETSLPNTACLKDVPLTRVEAHSGELQSSAWAEVPPEEFRLPAAGHQRLYYYGRSTSPI